jgi:hypothetical protein
MDGLWKTDASARIDDVSEGERLVDDLIARARSAAHEAERRASLSAPSSAAAARDRRRASLLQALLGRLQRDRMHLPLHCAWCGKLEIDGQFVAPEEFLSGDLPVRLRERATHGICPDCLAGASRDAASD